MHQLNAHPKVKLAVTVLPHYCGDSLPRYTYADDSGFDLCACFKGAPAIKLFPGKRVLVDAGIRVKIPLGYELQIRSRSGLSWSKGLVVANAPGTVDAGYLGELKVNLLNLSQETQLIEQGARIAQAVLAPVVQAEMLMLTPKEFEELETLRGANGYGSTGSR